MEANEQGNQYHDTAGKRDSKLVKVEALQLDEGDDKARRRIFVSVGVSALV